MNTVKILLSLFFIFTTQQLSLSESPSGVEPLAANETTVPQTTLEKIASIPDKIANVTLIVIRSVSALASLYILLGAGGVSGYFLQRHINQKATLVIGASSVAMASILYA